MVVNVAAGSDVVRLFGVETELSRAKINDLHQVKASLPEVNGVKRTGTLPGLHQVAICH